MKRTMRNILIGVGALALSGGILAPAAAATAITHEASPADGGYADVVVTTGAELAGEWMSVLVVDEDADVDDPDAADIVFIEQRQLDDDGELSFRVHLPAADLGGYDIALNTTGGTERYVAPLDGVADLEPGPDPEPEPEPEPEPTGSPTAPGDGDDDGAGAGGGDGSGDAPHDGADGAGAAGTGDAGGGDAGDSSDAGLAQTGAQVGIAVIVVALITIAGGLLLKARRARA